MCAGRARVTDVVEHLLSKFTNNIMLAAGSLSRTAFEVFTCKEDATRKAGDEHVAAGRLEPYGDGEELIMSFARQRCTWTSEHVR